MQIEQKLNLRKKIKNVYFLNHLSYLKKIQSSYFVICDQKLKTHIKSWHKGRGIYFVQGGERLKDIENFSFHTKNILKNISKMQRPPQFFIGVGGGSVTDFTGFFASVYKRGVPVCYIPTTLLSAIDASHGGKTALNVSSIKNVLGSYHFPEKVFIVKNLLQKTLSSEMVSAYGELVKIALIENQALYKKLKKKHQSSFNHLWSVMPSAIQSKWSIVSKDPYEEKKIRRCLNFGHTLGHCVESYHKIPHGKAVAMGILFALAWSAKRRYISSSLLLEAKNIIQHYTKTSSVLKIPFPRLKKLLIQDKKNTHDNKIEFVFIKGIGRPFVKVVLIDDILQFYKKHYLDILV